MINEQIRDREVRLIGENGEQLGIMSARDAMKLAKEAQLDLDRLKNEASSLNGVQDHRLRKISLRAGKKRKRSEEKAEDDRDQGNPAVTKY